jgi:CheY-like chemotaxis protein
MVYAASPGLPGVELRVVASGRIAPCRLDARQELVASVSDEHQGHGVVIRIGADGLCTDNQEQMAMTLMIVDDHRSFRDAARRVLESAGFEIVGEAADGESALQAIPSLRPDILLLDVQLPGIDGFEVASRLTERGDAPLIVIISSREGADYGPLVEQSGARGFIHKAELSGPAISAVLV